MCMASLIFNWKLVETESRVLKQFYEQTKAGTIFRTSQVLEDVGMFVRGEMFADASGDVSVGFTNITGTIACS